MATTTRIKRNDTAPALTSTLGVDLTGATVAILVRAVDESTPKVNLAAATITDATTGAVSYQWQVGDTDEGGLYFVEWVVTFGDGTKRSLPATTYDKVAIYGDLDDA